MRKWIEMKLVEKDEEDTRRMIKSTARFTVQKEQNNTSKILINKRMKSKEMKRKMYIVYLKLRKLGH